MKKNHKRFALISTFDKSKLYKVCKTLIFYNISIIATDSTAQQIKSYGFDCKTVSNITKYKEILDGRVKTLNPIIHGSLLFKRNNPNHLKEAIKNNHPLIDFVIVNLYPFKKAKNHGNFEKILEMIDIGGVAILRSASKNFRSVTTINGLEHYNKFIKELKINRGITSIGFRKKMAINTFHKTANYDLEIYKWLNKNNLQPNNKNSTKLKYGENPDQKAEYKFNKKQNCIFNNVISGKTLSYNNILDVDSGMECMHEFSEPTCVIIKHNTPCGVASSQNIKLAYHRALSCDPISSFGGVYIFNRSINENLANSLYKKYTDVICAPQFTKKALIKLKEKK